MLIIIDKNMLNNIEITDKGINIKKKSSKSTIKYIENQNKIYKKLYNKNIIEII